MSAVTFVPLQNERVLVQRSEHIITNYRIVQYDTGSRTTVSIPLHIVKEYKLTPKSAMFKVVNGIINVIGRLPRREEVRSAFALREYEELTVGERRKLCDISGVPFVHPDHPYNRWCTVGYHRPFSKRFYSTYAWLRGEEVFTYWPESFILTTYRLYQFDSRKRKLYMFPMHMVETFEAKGDRLRIRATTGKFEVRGKVPRQDHLLRVWQMRAWSDIPPERLEWLLMPFEKVNQLHPLSQYTFSESAPVQETYQAQESKEEMQTSASAHGSGVVFVKPVIKNKCDNCGAPMTWETIDWVGPDQYACPSCGHAHRVEYVRF
ncbi:MAG: hypothetical protein ACP6IT_02645 [Candidatus Thorarchaeota archaeon]